MAEFVMRQIGDNDPHVIQNVCREIRFNFGCEIFFYHLSAFNPLVVDAENATHLDAGAMFLFLLIYLFLACSIGHSYALEVSIRWLVYLSV